MGRIVVRREVTTLARVAGVRRLKGHATTFRRALAEFERKLAVGETVDDRAGRLAIEHLWRWLHGYTKPLRSRWESERPAEGIDDLERALGNGKNNHLEMVSGLLVIELPCDIPAENLSAGDHIMIKQGDPIPQGNFGAVRVNGQMALGHIFQLDPDHVRLGKSPGYVYQTTEVEIIGPMISGGSKLIPIEQKETDAALAMLNSVAAKPGTGDEEWPDIIDG
jgi:hypothetical protein